MTLADIFPDEDYRFNFRFQRGSVAEFFRPTEKHNDLIAQRRSWLQTAPSTYAALLSEGIPLLEEAALVAREEQTLGSSVLSMGELDPWLRCLDLGMA